MPRAYLKCRYYEGGFAFSREYCIYFKSSSQNSQKFLVDNQVFPEKGIEWCIVNRKEVIPVRDNEGLVRIIKMRFCEDEENAVVCIKDDGNMMISHYTVPVEEIEFKSKKGEKCRKPI